MSSLAAKYVRSLSLRRHHDLISHRSVLRNFKPPDLVACRYAGGTSITLHVKRSTPFFKVMSAVAKNNGVEVGSFSLAFGERRLGQDDTPEGLDMEDDDQ